MFPWLIGNPHQLRKGAKCSYYQPRETAATNGAAPTTKPAAERSALRTSMVETRHRVAKLTCHQEQSCSDALSGRLRVPSPPSSCFEIIIARVATSGSAVA